MTRRKRRRLRCAQNLIRRVEGRSKSDVDRYFSALDIVHGYRSHLVYKLDAFFRERYAAEVLRKMLFGNRDLTQA